MSDFDSWSQQKRRHFLKMMGTTLGALGASPALRFACDEMAGGVAYAQGMAMGAPTYFIEINLRDQWTHDHVAVYPGLAKDSNLKRANGDPASASLFYAANELERHQVNGTELFLTNDSKTLAPHLDSIAIFEMNEVAVGAIHGHEAANPNRSPGRSYDQMNGKRSMFENEKGSNHPQGCEAYYSSTPTPASLHNFHARQADPAAKNGVVFKGVAGNLHTVYHFAANLAGAELDRKQSADQMYSTFPSTTIDVNILKKPEYADAFVRLVKKADERFLKSRNVTQQTLASHISNIDRAKGTLYEGMPKVVSLPLTPMEESYWGEGVPPAEPRGGRVKAELWRQMAWAHKLVSTDLLRTLALEFDYEDFHGKREEGLVRSMAKQLCLPLARLIEQLKMSNIYDRTVIAIYTADGSRETRLESTGDYGKNSVILCGGKIKGGLYGDIRVAGANGNGNKFSYHAPDPQTGIPVAVGAIDTDKSKRTPGAVMWRTVAKAMGIPDALASSFPDTQNAKPMDFVLKA
jgi:hypothetical protein